MERLREDILDLGQADGPTCCIDGETGTGKTLVRTLLHCCGSRQVKIRPWSVAARWQKTHLSTTFCFGPMMPEKSRQLPAIEEARGGTWWLLRYRA